MPSPFVIRISSFIILVSALAWLGFRMAAPPPSTLASAESRAASKVPPPTVTITTPAEVFQKAFWKRPVANDHILHAERHEWQNKSGVSKWQWFIAVEPSRELVKHLITDNAFSLVATDRRQPTAASAHAPEWFPKDLSAHQVFANTTGTFTLQWNEKANLLFATDSGGGFRPGMPEDSKRAPAAVAASRVPLTPPPNPSKP